MSVKATITGSVELPEYVNPQDVVDDLRVVLGCHGHTAEVQLEVVAPTTFEGVTPDDYNKLSFGQVS